MGILNSYRSAGVVLLLVAVQLFSFSDCPTCPVPLYKSDILQGGDKPEVISVDVSGLDDLYLVATFGGDSYSSDQAIWAEPVLIDKNGRSIDLTSIMPFKAQLGWGKLYTNTNHRGQRLSIGGQEFSKGFWAHGPSMLHFELDGKYERFEAVIGIDSGAGGKGSVEFIITNAPYEMPDKEEYTGKAKEAGKNSLPIPLPADKSPHIFNTEAAKQLLDKGIRELVFIRRYTLNANHVYTEYVNSRWTPGGGLCVLDLETGKVRELARKLGDGVFNRFDVSFDGERIVFDFKKEDRAGYRIYEIGLDGSGLHQLTFPQENEKELEARYGNSYYHHGTDDLHPCYLPDGGIVFATTRCQYGILCDAKDVYTTKNLYRMDGDGGNMRTISNSPVSEASPAILPDGRILYHRWEYVDKAAGNVKSLWAMNPDGTGTAEVYGNTISFPETMIYARPIPGTNGKIVMLGASHCCPNNAMGAVIVIDTSKNIRSYDTMHFVTDDIRALAHSGFHFRDKDGNWKVDKTGTGGRLFKDPYPVNEELFIASRKLKGAAWDDPKAYDLVLLDSGGRERLLYRDENISCWHGYPIQSRQRPPVIAASKDEELAKQGLALCVVADVYKGMEGVERGEVKYLRILEEVPRPWSARKDNFGEERDGMAHTAIGDDLLGLKVQYGIVPVEADGSAHFYVPAMRNIYFQALDENYLAIQTERTYVHYMPGEKRSCIGCHEMPNVTPKASGGTPFALMRAPSKAAPQPGESNAKKLFDYDRDIQPIWDRHCVDCHSGKKSEGGIDLASDHEGVYSISYNNLIKLSKGEKQLLGNRKPRNEDVGSAGVEYLPPYSTGAFTSPLAAMLSRGRIRMRDPKIQPYADALAKSHPDVKLSESELLEVNNWLDINCQFHRSYWGRINAKYRGQPDYRPNVTFEEAIDRKIDTTTADGKGAGEQLSWFDSKKAGSIAE
jgi:hypothetical protein